MKKLLTIVLLMIFTTVANAQGTWSTLETPADELKGLEGGTHYIYSVEGLGEIEIYDWNDCIVRIGTYEGSFDWEEVKYKQVMRYSMSGGATVESVPYTTPRCSSTVLIGKYDNNDKLKDKVEACLEVDTNQHCKNITVNKEWFFYPQECRKIRKILKTLQSGDGYVRIVAKRKEMPDFDMKIKPYVEHK